jgi:hypothetical protein
MNRANPEIWDEIARMQRESEMCQQRGLDERAQTADILRQASLAPRMAEHREALMPDALRSSVGNIDQVIADRVQQSQAARAPWQPFNAPGYQSPDMPELDAAIEARQAREAENARISAAFQSQARPQGLQTFTGPETFTADSGHPEWGPGDNFRDFIRQAILEREVAAGGGDISEDPQRIWAGPSGIPRPSSPAGEAAQALAVKRLRTQRGRKAEARAQITLQEGRNRLLRKQRLGKEPIPKEVIEDMMAYYFGPNYALGMQQMRSRERIAQSELDRRQQEAQMRYGPRSLAALELAQTGAYRGKALGLEGERIQADLGLRGRALEHAATEGAAERKHVAMLSTDRLAAEKEIAEKMNEVRMLVAETQVAPAVEKNRLTAELNTKLIEIEDKKLEAGLKDSEADRRLQRELTELNLGPAMKTAEAAVANAKTRRMEVDRGTTLLEREEKARATELFDKALARFKALNFSDEEARARAKSYLEGQGVKLPPELLEYRESVPWYSGYGFYPETWKRWWNEPWK